MLWRLRSQRVIIIIIIWARHSFALFCVVDCFQDTGRAKGSRRSFSGAWWPSGQHTRRHAFDSYYEVGWLWYRGVKRCRHKAIRVVDNYRLRYHRTARQSPAGISSDVFLTVDTVKCKRWLECGAVIFRVRELFLFASNNFCFRFYSIVVLQITFVPNFVLFCKNSTNVFVSAL